MQQLQISRGKLEIRAGHEPLLNGELFLDYTHGKKYDSSNLTYELYAGCNGEAIKIGGQGVLSFIRPTLPGEGLPSNPIKGGVYYITEDIQLGSSNNNSTGTDTPEFHAGDLAIYVGENYHLDTLPRPANDIFYRHMGTFHDDAPGWIRVGNGGGGTSYELTFNPNNTNLSSTNLQEAIVELDRNKLAFGGVKFKKNAAVDDVDLTNNRVYDTEDNANTTILASDLIASPYSIKAGYYYSVGELAAGKNVTIQMGDTADPTVDIVLEEGDFLAVTSSSTSTANALTLSNLNFTKIAGGTHDSARLNYSAGSRNDSYTNNSTNWDTQDSGVSNVKEALDLLFESKADLDEHGKIILAQLPDTLIQSMVFAGGYTYSGTAENFVLPTGTDKTNGETELVQGDYFIYSGPQIKLEDTASTVSSNVRSSEGFINSGDWLVYEGQSKWSVIDNTSPITSIKIIDNYNSPADEDVIDQSTIQSVVGEIKFEGAERGSTGLSEVQLDADDGETITIHSKDAALISDTNAASVGEFYKEAGNKTLKKTGVSETDDGLLTFDEARGVKITGGVEAASGVAGKTEGDPLSVSIAQNPEQSTEGDISLLLPAQGELLNWHLTYKFPEVA